MTNIEVMFDLRHPNAKMPVRGTPHSFGLDLYAADIEWLDDRTVKYDTGLRLLQDLNGEVGMPICAPRSSIRKHRIVLLNSIGVIDGDYMDTIQATFMGFPQISTFYKPGDRILQLLFVPQCQLWPINASKERINFQVLQKQRTGGHGSTGS